jgi:hypothetical protein
MKEFLQIGVATDAIEYFHESLKLTLVRNKLVRFRNLARQQRHLRAPAFTNLRAIERTSASCPFYIRIRR